MPKEENSACGIYVLPLLVLLLLHCYAAFRNIAGSRAHGGTSDGGVDSIARDECLEHPVDLNFSRATHRPIAGLTILIWVYSAVTFLIQDFAKVRRFFHDTCGGVGMEPPPPAMARPAPPAEV